MTDDEARFESWYALAHKSWYHGGTDDHEIARQAWMAATREADSHAKTLPEIRAHIAANPLSPEAQAARAPRPPDELVGALQDTAHGEPESLPVRPASGIWMGHRVRTEEDVAKDGIGLPPEPAEPEPSDSWWSRELKRARDGSVKCGVHRCSCGGKIRFGLFSCYTELGGFCDKCQWKRVEALIYG